MTQLWVTVPEGTLGTVSETLLRVGLAAAVLEHLGERPDVALDESRNGGWAADGALDAEPGSFRCFVRVVPGPAAHADRRRADALVTDLHRWLDEVLGPPAFGAPRAARVEVEVAVRPQHPQGNPQLGRPNRVTAVTAWG